MSSLLRGALVLVLAIAPSALGALPLTGASRRPPVTIAGAPRSLVTLAVPLPADFPDSLSVSYRVERTGEAELLGRMEGIVTAGGTRQVMLTLRVPADARVGLLDVADVQFLREDGEVAVVPIILRVPAVRVLRLIAPPSHSGLRQGDRLELTFVLRNLGNAPERAVVAFTPPPSWSVRGDADVTVSVGPFEEREVRVRVLVPAFADGGEYLFGAEVIRTASSESAVAGTSVHTRLQVSLAEARAPGLALGSFVSAATGLGSTALAAGLSLTGPVADSVHMDLRVLPLATSNGAAGLGITGSGAAGLPLQLSLSAPTWQASLGNTSVRVTDLTGINVAGVGITGTSRRDSSDFMLLASRPNVALGIRGEHLALSGGIETEYGRIGGSISQLSERSSSFAGRELRAIGADWTRLPVGDWNLDLGLAGRQFFDEAGVGARVQASRVSSAGRARVRFAHAAGGTRAFAAAVDQLDFDGERVISSRFTVGGAANVFRDENPVLGESWSQLMNLYGRFALRERVSLLTRLERTAFDVTPNSALAGSFGSEDRALTVGLNFRAGAWNLTSELRGSYLTRSSELFSGARSVREALSNELTLNGSRTLGSIAMLSTGSTVIRSTGNVGLPATQLRSFIDLSGVRLPRVGRLLQLNAQLSHTAASEQRDLIGMQFSAVSRLPFGLDIAAVVERNPFFRSANGGARWLTGIRVSTSTELGMPQMFVRVAGVVFEDRNGNGKREDDEPGVPGVVLRQNGVRIVTESDGGYRVPANVRGRLQVDPLGLPRGFVMSPLYARDFSEQRDIPLVQTGSVTVTLAIAVDPEGRRPDVNLANAQVWLRDAYGFEWVGRVATNGTVAFENVPAGRYNFRFDFSRLSEILLPEEGAMVEVAPREHREVTATLRGRGLRLIAPPSRDGGRGTGGRGSGSGAERTRSQNQH